MISSCTLSVFVMTLLTVTASASFQRREWGAYYYRINSIEREQRKPHKYCIVQAVWASYFKISKPLCSSLSNYYPEQQDGSNKWCVEKDGTRIPNTMDDVDFFPYDCKKTRDCPSGLIRETTGRCEATCGERGRMGFQTKFFCKDKCICPRGKYRDESGKCIWFHDCKKVTCTPPMEYTDCASKCPFTCATNSHICDYACDRHNNCVCPQGMVLMSRRNGTCIWKGDCPKCEGGSLPTDCAPPCPSTCAGDEAQCDSTSEECVKGVYCICPPNTIQLDMNLPVRCVKRDECPAKCAAPLVPKRCTKPCEATCTDIEPECDGSCKTKFICGCPDGYIRRNRSDASCMKYEDCMSERLGCQLPARAVKCERGCQLTCQPRAPLCLQPCELGYTCGCPSAYRLDIVGGKTCIKEDECPEPCEKPKIYANCGSLCPPTCQDPAPSSCRRGCRREMCICPPGMVQPDKKTVTCIDPNDCPGCQAPAFPVECTPECPENCKNPRLGWIFGRNCTRACPKKFVCGCPDGYILKTQNGKECIRKEDCPSSCEYPLIFASCASMCQLTCENPNPRACRRGCSSQLCICGHGTIQLNDDTITCVTKDKCPKCSEPKFHKECPSKCQPTCNNPEPLPGDCEVGCREDKCVCPEGMILLSESVSTCVTPSKCPKICKFPEISSSCRSSCEATCDKLSFVDSLNCPAKCGEEQCVCANGYVRRSSTDPTCVDIASCPTTAVSCEAPKVYAECPSRCQPTCDDPNPIVCSRGCDLSISCVCPQGYVQRNSRNRTCLRLEQCPTVCVAPKIYVDCASKCRPTCAVPNSSCGDSCDSSVNCVCPPGMVHPNNGNDTCIHALECTGCPSGAIATRCASACPATCDQPNPGLCASCLPNVKCECAPGTVQRSLTNTTCIDKSECE